MLVNSFRLFYWGIGVIREALPEEAFTVTSFMKAFETVTTHVKVDPEYSGAKYKKMIEDGIAKMFILEENGKMIGGLGCVKGADLHFPRTIAVETYWYVDQNHSGEGIKLLKHFEDWAKNNNCDAVAMVHLVDSYPDSLERLYIRRGYELVEKHYIKGV